MLEAITLGIIQGITEWLPVSSEGILLLVKINIFDSQVGWEAIIKEALFLHLGTFLAALIYFHKDVWQILKTFFNYQSAPKKDKRLIEFLTVTTLVTGLLGYFLLEIFSNLENQVEYTGQVITLIVGLLLLATAIIQLRVSKKGQKQTKDLTDGDNWLLGLVQGLAVLPGLSRSGLTVSVLLLKRFDKTTALRLSFLMSLPVVLGGNIIAGFKYFTFSIELFLGFIFSFIFGLLTISLLLKLARKINFGYFLLVFAILVIASFFISMV